MAAASIPGSGAAGLRILPESFFLSADFESFAAEFRGLGIKEIHRHSLYAYKAYATAGQTELLLFDQNIGSATNGLGDTNMQVAGQMSGNEAMVILNVLLAVFNMVPVPPLDGGNVLAGLLPGKGHEIFDRLRPYGFLIIYGLLLTGILWQIVEPVQAVLVGWLL